MWARERTDIDDRLLALVVALKCFQRMGRFPKAGEVPDAVPVYSSPRTAESHRAVVRTRLGAIRNPGKARKIADRAIRKAAWVKNNPPDLINVALEHLVQASLELPAFSTLDGPAHLGQGGIAPRPAGPERRSMRRAGNRDAHRARRPEPVGQVQDANVSRAETVREWVARWRAFALVAGCRRHRSALGHAR